MIKEVIKYVDFDGNERTTTAYFNINKAELLDLQLSEKEGFDAMIRYIIENNDVSKSVEVFKKILKLSYGVKSADGNRFVKNQEVWEEFEQSLAYEEIFMKLATDANYSEKFIKGVLPDVEGMVSSINQSVPVNNVIKIDNKIS